MLSCLRDSKSVHYSHQCSSVKCKFKDVVRYLFLAALRENNVNSWVKLGRYLQKVSFLTEDMKADVEIAYYGKRSIVQLLDVLKQSSNNVTHTSKTKLLPTVETLKSIFSFIQPNHEQSEWDIHVETHPFTEITSIKISQDNVTTPWECMFSKLYKPINSLSKELLSLLCRDLSGNTFSCQNVNILFKLQHAADFTKPIRSVKDMVNCQNSANGQDIRKSLNSQNFSFDDDNDPKNLIRSFPKTGFEAITYFAVCHKFGFHGYMYYQRRQNRVLNDSPYDLEPTEIPEVSLVLVCLDNTFST
ncbi:hypothetical protein PHET_07277 [Paragonimus heterotremus]|uniref:Uncharacterized protein n=1 Tax=Paragonimus heterotremus TaxID=100268 RepID=A0A8J4WXA0_9TREM|nr:hypothetical protein PHET_07277 [Paragonimus heterotremus]